MLGVATDSIVEQDSRTARRWPQLLSDVFQTAVKSRPVMWVVFTVLYAVPTVYLARIKLFWDDEFFTYYLSRTSSWHDLLRALATGADQHPPSFYYLIHLSTTLFGSSHVTVRLPAILAFWLLCVCLYEIVRDLTTPAWAAVAMFFPLATEFYNYASEARGYGLVAGFAALAVLSWLRLAAHRKRTVYLPLLAVALAAAVASHYYAVLIVVPLALGELVRTRHTRKIDWLIWIAFASAGVPILAFLGTIRSAQGYSSHFWAVPLWSEAFSFYQREFGLGMFTLLGALAVNLSFRAVTRTRPDSPSAPLRGPSWTPWQAIAICTLAALPILTMVLAKFVVHGFTTRYCISALIGVTALLFYFVSRIAFRPGAAAIGIFACLFIFSIQARILKEKYENVREETTQDVTNLSRLPNAQIAVMKASDAHRLSFYAPRELASRIAYLADPNSSIAFLGHDTIDRGLLDLRPWFPINIVRADSFLNDNHQFYVFGETDTWTWLTFELSKWGQTKLLARGEEQRLLFSVDNVRFSADPRVMQEQHAIQSTMLFATLPKYGPSLCVLWMGPHSCP
jgi:dolichyl-phosphate-mannose-protein mannosyltransferase